MKRPPKNLRFFFFYCARKCVRICIASIDKGEHACRRPKRWPAAFSALAGVSPLAACGLAGRLFAPTAGPSEFFGSEKEEMARRTRPPGWRPATRTTPPAPLFTPKNRVSPCQSMLSQCMRGTGRGFRGENFPGGDWYPGREGGILIRNGAYRWAVNVPCMHGKVGTVWKPKHGKLSRPHTNGG